MSVANTTIQIKKSLVSGNSPTTLQSGELAINLADDKLFYSKPGGSISFITNQQSFSTINANGSLLLAGSGSDTLSFIAGNKILLTGNNTSKSITLNFDDGGYYQNSVLFANSTGYISNSSSLLFHSGNNTLVVNALSVSSLSLKSGSINLGIGSGQGYGSVSIGAEAGNTSQGTTSVAIGFRAGQSSQGGVAVAVGSNAGNATQSTRAIAIGSTSGYIQQGDSSIAIGSNAGRSYQGNNSIAIGYLAGVTNQVAGSIILNATGATLDAQTYAGLYVDPVRNDTSSKTNLVAYNTTSKELTYFDGSYYSNASNMTAGTLPVSRGGTGVTISTGTGAVVLNTAPTFSGLTTSSLTLNSSSIKLGTGSGQGFGTVAIGGEAGNTSQGTTSVAIGYRAGQSSQGGIAVGSYAGQTSQGGAAVALGQSAGKTNQGGNAIAIGSNAGVTNQVAGSIILNATGVTLDAQTNAGLYINPVRNNTSSKTNLIAYDTTSKELTYFDGSLNYLPLTGGSLSGTLTINSNLIVTGNTTLSGNVTTVSANNLSVKDNMFYLNSTSNTANPDLGFAGNYNDGTYKHAGFFRDATDGYWKVFDNYLPEPDASPYIDTSNSSFRLANFSANNISVTSSLTTSSLTTDSVVLNTASTRFGFYAGNSNQGFAAVAVGPLTGSNNQGSGSIAIGSNAGNSNQGGYAVAVGVDAGTSSQGGNSVAIGNQAGNYMQGNFAIAIGYNAGVDQQIQNSIILNASGDVLDAKSNAGLYINPVRYDTSNTSNIVYYNAATKELTYSTFNYAPALTNLTTTMSTPVSGLLKKTDTNSYGVDTSRILKSSEEVVSNYKLLNPKVRLVPSSSPATYTLNTNYTSASLSSNGFLTIANADSNMTSSFANTWLGQTITWQGAPNAPSTITGVLNTTTNTLPTNGNNIGAITSLTINGLVDYFQGSDVRVNFSSGGLITDYGGDMNPLISNLQVGNSFYARLSGYSTPVLLTVTSYNGDIYVSATNGPTSGNWSIIRVFFSGTKAYPLAGLSNYTRATSFANGDIVFDAITNTNFKFVLLINSGNTITTSSSGTFEIRNAWNGTNIELINPTGVQSSNVVSIQVVNYTYSDNTILHEGNIGSYAATTGKAIAMAMVFG